MHFADIRVLCTCDLSIKMKVCICWRSWLQILLFTLYRTTTDDISLCTSYPEIRISLYLHIGHGRKRNIYSEGVRGLICFCSIKYSDIDMLSVDVDTKRADLVHGSETRFIQCGDVHAREIVENSHEYRLHVCTANGSPGIRLTAFIHLIDNYA